MRDATIFYCLAKLIGIEWTKSRTTTPRAKQKEKQEMKKGTWQEKVK